MTIDEDKLMAAINTGALSTTSGQVEVGYGVGESWKPAELAEAWDNPALEQAVMMLRSDGVALIYEGRVHEVKGEPEGGKGWFALHCVKEQVQLGNKVWYIDWEDQVKGIMGRLRSLGLTRELIVESGSFSYIRPEEQFGDAVASEFDRLLEQEKPRFVVLDGVTEAMVTNGLNPLDNTDAARFYAMLVRRIQDAGAAVLLIDHVTKSKDGRGRYAIGAQHKLAAIDGASYTIEIVEPFGRGRRGMSRITIAKDRPGFVRQSAAGGKIIAELHMWSNAEGEEVKLELNRPDGVGRHGEILPTVYMSQITKYVESQKPQMPTLAQVREAVGCRKETAEMALRELVDTNHLARETRAGRGGGTVYAFLKNFEVLHPVTEADFYEAPEDDYTS